MGKNNKKTKILYAVTKSNWGGAQRYVYDLATNMPKDEFEIAVALGGSGLLKNKLEKENIRTIAIQHLARDINILDDFFVFFSLVKILWQEKPDIVHLNSSKIGGLGAFAARVAGIKKIIFTAHGWYFNEDRSWFVKTVTLFLSWLTVLFSHQTIIISESQKKEMPRFFFISGKIIMIHNGIKPFELKGREEARRALFGERTAMAHEHDFWLGTIAELHPNKNLANAIKSVSHYNKNHQTKIFYTTIGGGEERQTLEKLIREEKSEQQIFLAGFINNASSLLSAFDAFLLPSIKEGLPYVLLEAGLAGLPVIATSIGGIPDIIENGKTGILAENTDAVAIARAIALELSDKNLASYGNNLREKVKTQFSLSKMILETSNLYLF